METTKSVAAAVEFTPSREHLLRAYRLATRKLRRSRLSSVSSVVIGFGVGLAIAWPSSSGRLGRDGLVIDLLFIGLILGLGVWGRRLVTRRLERLYDQREAYRDQVTLNWDEEGVSFTTDWGTERVPWRRIMGYRESDDLILLFQADLYYSIIPRAALNPAQAKDLEDMIRRRVPLKT